MNIQELKNKINLLGLSSSSYSINEGLKPNAYILEEIYGKWNFFYLDIRGNRENAQTFNSSEEAFNYLYSKLLNESKHPPSRFIPRYPTFKNK